MAKKNKNKVKKSIANREKWLRDAFGHLNKILELHGLPTAIARVSVSFKLVEGREKERCTMGICAHPSMSGDKIAQIFISGRYIFKKTEVLETLLHEMVHAICPNERHSGKFVTYSNILGFNGIPTANYAGKGLAKTLGKIMKKLGAFPHSPLRLPERKKQSSRNILIECPLCQYKARTSRSCLSRGICSCPDSDCDWLGNEMLIMSAV